MEKSTETLMNIDIFDFTDVEPFDEGCQYYDVKFKFESLRKYDGFILEVTYNWDITVWNENQEIDKFNIIEVLEFQNKLKELINFLN